MVIRDWVFLSLGIWACRGDCCASKVLARTMCCEAPNRQHVCMWRVIMICGMVQGDIDEGASYHIRRNK
jgi:hypothetical protein